jgi:hypothetical protein
MDNSTCTSVRLHTRTGNILAPFILAKIINYISKNYNTLQLWANYSVISLQQIAVKYKIIPYQMAALSVLRSSSFWDTVRRWLVVCYNDTPWSRVLLEKLTGLQLVKKFPAFYGTRRAITTFTSGRHLSLS